MMWLTLAALLTGYGLDLLFGDPRQIYHPIRLIGALISVLEKGIRNVFPKTSDGELAGGTVLVLLTVGISTGVPAAFLAAAVWIHPVVYWAVASFWSWQILATKSLKTESMKVYAPLKAGDLPEARHAVSMIVGRDTERLSEEGVAKAAVETVAENTSDGIVAPLLFLAIGGPAFGFLYKSVNTMDSMVGYKNDKYLYFGRAAARLDDVLNFIPSRISAWLMIAAAAVLGMDGKNAKRIYLRDRHNHASPNSAQTEAVMAGALRVQLAGDAWYFGKRYKKPTIGDPYRAVEPEDIVRANRLMYLTSFFALAVFGLLRAAVGIIV
ncbi:MAG TPA: adenosylcobinamide-phosphate synthase CbiB [Candidatus Fusicatenibacter intestinigallinarum]|uniref:Cobalamin biosynthesis protein CobD n=1 Tax=Candidatus Fusicatenibacter intestinigallinarum TaxID=2838598 RepID=A0A9D2NC42_9FIRM|nr:adenosylcobinamide-phosphate synthase CbiB [Candidatus Fusicatenibacter intestinigallinarum]